MGPKTTEIWQNPSCPYRHNPLYTNEAHSNCVKISLDTRTKDLLENCHHGVNSKCFFRMTKRKIGGGGNLWGEILLLGDGPLENCTKSASQYFCETCDKDLKDEETQTLHFSEHIKCAYPGCKFDAHFLVIFISFYQPLNIKTFSI